MILIKNGTIHTMTSTGTIIGDVLIQNGKIISIIESSSSTLKNKNNYTSLIKEASDMLHIIDASNCIVMPGMIEAHCHVGIAGDKKTTDSDDSNEVTSPITPYLRGMDGINPMDASFHKAIKAGITSIMTGPGSSNIVGGQFLFMKTHGHNRNIESSIVKAPAAMKVALGENPKKAFQELKVSPMTRMANCALLREELYKAKAYLNNKEKSEKENKKKGTGASIRFDIDFRMECWIPVLKKEIPIKVHCHRADDILTAIRIGKEFDLMVTLDHCSEGHFIVDEIKDSNYPCIVGPSMASRDKEEAVNVDFKTSGILNKKGVLVALTTDHPVIQIEYLPLCAGLAVKHGLPMEEGLKAITIYPAMICGVEHRLGSIEIGKDADIAIFDGNPMETFTNTLYTIIDGSIVYQMDGL